MPSPYRLQATENHELLATGLQEGIGLAIDQRAFTTEVGGTGVL
jgi:hypothetical protein